MGKRVAYQGIKGSFSSMAAAALVGPDHEALQTTRFREIFEHVAAGRADIGVVPIENALAGSIHENYDLLGEFSCAIVGEHYCPVQLNLMGVPAAGTSLAAITQVISHPKALEQCSHFLESLPGVAQVNYSDTAGAALHIKERGDPALTAIASEEAASAFGLTIIARGIQNHSLNSTRFVAIAKEPSVLPSRSKCSLVITLPHEPGSLARLLAAIAGQQGNVTKIESRPILGKPFEYRFYIDIEAPRGVPHAVTDSVEAASQIASSCRVLGLYGASPAAA